MKRHIQFAFVHVLHWAALYGAFVIGSEGALSVLKFFCWLTAIFVGFALTDKGIAELAKQPSAPVRTALSFVQGWVTLLALVWFGHFATAAAWAWVILCVRFVHEKAAETRAAAGRVGV